jgi:hypothetical protein
MANVTLKCYLNYENTKIEKFNYFKGDYDKLRQELDIDWNEILNDKNSLTINIRPKVFTV